MFENCITSTDQGNIGVSSAIFKLTQKGIVVSIPFIQNIKYDLVAEINGELKKVQVKTTIQKNKNKNRNYIVNLKTCGGNKSGQKIRNRDVNDYDYLFVLCDNEESFFIPKVQITSNTTLTITKEISDLWKV